MASQGKATAEDSLKVFPRGWCWGRPEFKARMLERMAGKLGEHHFGAMRLETADVKAERIMPVELARLPGSPIPGSTRNEPHAGRTKSWVRPSGKFLRVLVATFP